MSQLTEELDYHSNHKLPTYQKLKYLINENSQKLTNNILTRHDNIKSNISKECVTEQSICFGGADGTLLYFDTSDNLSIRDYWLDENSIGKIADSYDDFIKNFEMDMWE